jgi:hypothetical protein
VILLAALTDRSSWHIYGEPGAELLFILR